MEQFKTVVVVFFLIVMVIMLYIQNKQTNREVMKALDSIEKKMDVYSNLFKHIPNIEARLDTVEKRLDVLEQK